VDATLYGAGAGITLFLADLAGATADAEVAAVARDAARFVAGTSEEGYFGLYTGYAGMVFAVRHAASVLGDGDLAHRATGMLDHLAGAAQPAGDGLEWPAFPGGRGPWQDLYHAAGELNPPLAAMPCCAEPGIAAWCGSHRRRDERLARRPAAGC
jgi:hypothetical protein